MEQPTGPPRMITQVEITDLVLEDGEITVNTINHYEGE
jgi:hypothetical protein